MKPDATISKDRLIGKTIGKYEIIGELGEGGMGKVYLAEDKKLGRKAALKFVLPQYASDRKLIAQFEQEARITAALNHPNIVTIYDFDEYWLDENINGYYIAMEYVEGQSLKDLIKSFIDKKEHLRFDQIFDIVIQISKGLLAAHKKNIIHRDLKPGNILVSHEGTAKISDFGLAKLTDDTSGSLRSIPLGTVPYMSPEQARMEKLDQCSDIFSLGIVFYELITLKRPFEGSSREDILAAIKNKKPEPLTRHRPDASDGLQRIVGKALNKSRSQRYQNLNGMIVDLEREKNEFLKTQPLPPIPIEKNKWPESISILWRKLVPYRMYLAIAISLPVILAIISLIADILQIYSTIKSKPSVISISTMPQDAEVVLNGKFIGTTPIPNTSVQAGEISLNISKAGYASIDTSIPVEQGKEWMGMFVLKKAPEPLSDIDRSKDAARPLPPPIISGSSSRERISNGKKSETQPSVSQPIVEAPLFGELNVLVKPFGSIYINREPRKRDTDVLYTESLPVGMHRLLVLHPEHGRWEEEIIIKPNALLNLTIDFNEKFIATVTSTPVWGEIFVDDQPTGKQTPQQLNLRVGQHIIKVQRQGYIADPGSKIIDLKKSDTTKVRFKLIKL